MEQRSIEAALEVIPKLEQRQLDVGLQTMQAAGSALYLMDFLAAGAINRSLSLSSAFVTLIRARNLLCAGALLRMQLDTGLRFSAAWLVPNPHEFALAVLRGEHVRRLRDARGKPMTDERLVRLRAREYPWMPRVYGRTSGFVHFSATHLFAAFEPPSGVEESARQFGLAIGATDNNLPDERYIEAADAFAAATEFLLDYLEGWRTTKERPELVAGQRQTKKPGEDLPAASGETNQEGE